MVKIVLEHTTKSREHTRDLVRLIRQVRRAAAMQPGFVHGETLVDADDPCHVIVLTTWRSQEDWKAWDESPERAATRSQIESLLVIPFNAMVLEMPVVWREDQVYVF